jgi:hypothetical protein
VSSTAAINVAAGVVIVALLLVRQMKPRRARENSALRLVLVLAVIGVFELSNTIGHRSVASATVAWIVASLLIGGALGAARAATVTIWRAADGAAWRRGTLLTGVLWIVSLGAHFALEVGIDDSTKIAALGASSILLYLAITLGVQREVVRWRAAKISPELPPPAGV